MTVAVFTYDFNSCDGVGYKITIFVGFAGILPGVFVDFIPFGRRQDAVVEPLLFGFL